MERCNSCYIVKELEICHKCFWNMVCKNTALDWEEDIAKRIKWDLKEDIKEVLYPLLERMDRIEAILKIKINKRKKGSDFTEKPNQMEGQK